MRRRIPLLVLFLVLAAPGASQAAVTLGAPVASLDANTGQDCQQFLLFPGPPSCTVFGLPPAGQPATWTSQTPRGQWVIVRVRVRAGATTGPMVVTALRALRSQAQNPLPAPAACCSAPFESQVFTPAANQVTQIATRIPVINTVEVIDREPVEVVDYLGLSVLAAGVQLPMHTSPAVAGAVGSFSFPALRAPGQAVINSGFSNKVPLLQADYEPDADGDGFGDETQDTTPPGAAGAGTPGSAPNTTTPVQLVAPALAAPATALRELGTLATRSTFGVPVLCPTGNPTDCIGTIGGQTVRRLPLRARAAAKTQQVVLTTRSYRIAPGRTSQVTLKLPSAARKELRRRGKLQLNVTISQTAPSTGSTTRRITLRVLPTTVRANRSGSVTLLAEEPVGATTKKAAYELRERSGAKRRLARRSQNARPGRVASVRLTLSSRARSTLRRRGKLAVVFGASYRDATGATIRTSRKVTIRKAT